MEVLKTSSRCKLTVVILSGASVAIMFAALAFAPRPATAKPEFTAQTKLPCGDCHVSPGGGGPLKPLGQQFKDNGNKLPPK
jgi:hypothetical protein